MKIEKDIKTSLIQNKGSVIGAVWAAISLVGYAIYYPKIGGNLNSAVYRLLFLFVSILDKIEGIINPNFSLSYTLVFTYRANIPLFLIILGVGILVGGVIGAGAEYILNNTVDYVDKHQEEFIIKLKRNSEKIREKVGSAIENTRKQVQKYQKKKDK